MIVVVLLFRKMYGGTTTTTTTMMWILIEYESVVDCLKVSLFSMDVASMEFSHYGSPAQQVLVSLDESLHSSGLHGVRMLLFDSHPTSSQEVIEWQRNGREEESREKCFEWLDWRIKSYDHDFEAVTWQGIVLYCIVLYLFWWWWWWHFKLCVKLV